MNISDGFSIDTAIPIYVGPGGVGRFDVASEIRRQLTRIFGTDDMAYLISSESPHWHPIGRPDLDMHLVALTDRDDVGHTLFFRMTTERWIPARQTVAPPVMDTHTKPNQIIFPSQKLNVVEQIPIESKVQHDINVDMPPLDIDLSGTVEETRDRMTMADFDDTEPDTLEEPTVNIKKPTKTKKPSVVKEKTNRKEKYK
jgi:hypothetical protein